MLRVRRTLFVLVLMPLSLLAGCGQDSPGPLNPTPLQDLGLLPDELETLEGLNAESAVLDDRHCLDPARARALRDEARDLLGEAREALSAGAREEARRLFTSARELVIQAVLACRGTDAVTELADRVDELLEAASDLVARHDDPEARRFLERTMELRDLAGVAFNEGNLTDALRLLLKSMAIAVRILIHLDPEGVFSRLQMAVEEKLVELEGEIEQAQPRAQRYFEHAVELRDAALRAAEAGGLRKAIHLIYRALHAARIAERLTDAPE